MEGFIFSEDLCRLCLWRSNKLLPIFSQEGELQGISSKIGMCLPISVTQEDVLPKLICSQCIYKLEMFSEFRNSCVRSEQLLKRYSSHEPVHISACHTVVVQMQDEVKVEVQEPDPIAVEQEMQFMCIIPDNIYKEAIEEYKPSEIQNESATSIRADVMKSGDSKKDVTPLKGGTKRKRKAVRQNPALKKPNNKAELRRVHPIHSPIEHRSSHAARVPALASSRRAMHRCKHCSKNFPSRVQLSQHLASSNCLFQYTCRYCAKIFVSAENRIHHERNHRDKKNFMCGICEEKFQSSFDLNVHTLQGCECSAVHNRQHSAVRREAKRQVTQEKDVHRINKTKLPKGTLNKISGVKVKQNYKCIYCRMNFTQILPYNKHIRSCRHAVTKSRVREIHRKSQIKQTYKIVSLEQKQDNSVEDQETNCKIQRVLSDDIKINAASRRKQNLDNKKAIALQNSSTKDSSDTSPKESLLAVLGLKEAFKPADLKTVQKVDETETSKVNTDVTEDEVVTVCDICRKIFTSESGMLNHQTTVHNRNLTAEKINSLMRVEI